MPTTLETERLRLRPWDDGDVEFYRSLVTERGNGTPDADWALASIERQRVSARTNGFQLLVVVAPEGVPIGYCGLTVGRSSAAEPELAYELMRASHGNGYATEAARAVVEAARISGRPR